MTAPGQLRRQARRVRRYGIQPMIIMGDGDRLPATTAVVVGWFLWRYRSELGPAAFAALLFAAGLALHVTRPGWWPWPIATAVVVAAAAVTAGKRLGLPTRAERAYAAAVILCGGGWLAGAATAGPKTAPLPFLLAAGGLLLAMLGGHTGAAVPASGSSASWRPGPSSLSL
jgi:hypothetical protein